jgi:hypothetical protein
MDPPIRFFAGWARRFLKKLPVTILTEDSLSPVAPIHDVINGARIPHPSFSGHENQLPKGTASSQAHISIIRDDVRR